jgi:hypothetical protein
VQRGAGELRRLADRLYRSAALVAKQQILMRADRVNRITRFIGTKRRRLRETTGEPVEPESQPTALQDRGKTAKLPPMR